jgi:DHA1 family bicyclomycin/chloramphenicol resistance-like MFS transporter
MPLRILLILGALSAFGPLAIDFYLPSFPALAQAFATDVEHIQLSLASYFVGIALGQLIYGPLADRYGRRRPLIAGLILFSLASLACALAPTLEWLIAARFVQALGGCAGMVISRAVVRDLCDPTNTARVYSQLMLVMGVAPILAPTGGGLLLTAFGWPAIFICLTGFAVLCLLAVLRGLPESLPADALHAPLSGALGQYRRLLGDRSFIGHALSGGFGMAGMFAYVAGSPFILIQLYGVSPEHYGWLFGGNAFGFILTAQLNSWLVRRHGPAFLLPRMICVYLLLALSLSAVALWQPLALWVLMLPLFCCTAILGGIIPNASACAMAGQREHAGSASALLGCIQFTLAASASSLVGLLHDGTAFPMALVITLCAVAALLCSVLTLRQSVS